MAAFTSRPSSPKRAWRRSRSSPAALLVKVMANTFQGRGRSTAKSLAAAPAQKPSAAHWRRMENSSSVSSGTSSLSQQRPNRRRFATRWISTVVLPLPAPARIRTGPERVSTAWRCILLRFLKLWSKICFFRAKNSCRWFSVIGYSFSTSVLLHSVTVYHRWGADGTICTTKSAPPGIFRRNAFLLESVFIAGQCQMGERFFRPARQKSAELLGVIQGFLTQQGGKRAGQMVLDGCEYRFLRAA